MKVWKYKKLIKCVEIKNEFVINSREQAPLSRNKSKNMGKEGKSKSVNFKN